MMTVLPTVARAAALPGFALAADTQRVAFYTRGGSVDVKGALASLTKIEQALGQPLRRKAAYYRYGSAQEIAAGTGYYASGVTFAGQVHSTEERHDHELVHLVAAELGQPGRFFQEGLAVAMTGEKTLGRREVKEAVLGAAALSAWVKGFDAVDPSVGYAVAGSFVRYLIRTHGLRRVAAFFRACGPGADHQAAFAATFGSSLDQAGAAWAGTL
jgi:hypothetical protein